MFRAMLWKESREQAAILIALLVLGSAVIAVAAALGSSIGLESGLGDFRAYTNAGRLAVLALSIAAGVVVGGSLFAGERENETMPCLESLPVRRWSIWWSKMAAGLVLTVVASAILLGTGAAIGALGMMNRTTWLVAGALMTLLAFAWGAFGSTIARNTLGACAGGLLSAVVFGVPIVSVAHALLLALTRRLWVEPPARWMELEPVVAVYLAVLVPMILAGIVFTAPDRARYLWHPKHPSLARAVRRSPGTPGRIRAMFWLVRQQWIVAAPVGAVLALAVGLAALLEEAHLIVGWPLVASFAGVCAGVFAWNDERARDTHRYWGERRLPPGLPWIVKVAASFLVGLVWTLLLFLPSLVRVLASESRGGSPALARAFGDGILGHEARDILPYLLVWPAYGFAFGHFAGILFRKTIVAVGVGMLVAAPFAAFWLPSLVTGGVHGWQLWPVPLAVLASTRLLVRPWSADRLGTARPLATVGGVACASIAFLVFGLAWRALEVPVTAEIDADLRFAATVPQLDSEDGGRAFRSAVSSGLANALSRIPESRRDNRLILGPDPTNPSRVYLYELAANRWPEADLAALGPWLKQVIVVESVRQLKAAGKLPPGPIENPRTLNATTPDRESLDIRPAVCTLLTYGLWHQRSGNPGEFLECLDAALAIIRNARTQQPTLIHRMSYAAEAPIFDAVDLWLERLGPRPELARRALTRLENYRRTVPRDPSGAAIVDRMIDRNTLTALPQWATKELEIAYGGNPMNPGGFIQSPARMKAETETELAGFAIVVPWERERMRRILGVRNADPSDAANHGRLNSWFGRYLLRPSTIPLAAAIAESETHANLATAQAALALYAIERGRPATALDDLVPDYLPAVPVDPYSSKPLRYRVSKGETIEDGRIPEDPNSPRWDGRAWLELEWETRSILAGAIGGAAYADQPEVGMPGAARGTPFPLRLDFVGAVAGGIVQHDLEDTPNRVTGYARTRPAGSVENATTEAPLPIDQELLRAAGWILNEPAIRLRRIQPGQGVVWSIGPDRLDGGGKSQVGSRRNGPANAGDRLRVVPAVRRR
jgi:hypothetical protein